jgi:hypothetical protein
MPYARALLNVSRSGFRTAAEGAEISVPPGHAPRRRPHGHPVGASGPDQDGQEKYGELGW